MCANRDRASLTKMFSKAFLVNVLALLLAVSTDHVEAQGFEDQFGEYSFQGSSNLNLLYRFRIPPNISSLDNIPLIVFLHGSGGGGYSNKRQLRGGNRYGIELWLRDDISEEFPAFILVPQLPFDTPWANPNSSELATYTKVLVELISSLENDFQIDGDRIYLLGQSLGGAGVWDLVSKQPDRFAAAVPICGFGNPERVKDAKNVPIWAFHGELDKTVRVERSRELVSSLRSVGGNITYTEYPEVQHVSWIPAFSEPELPAWLFSHSRNNESSN